MTSVSTCTFGGYNYNYKSNISYLFFCADPRDDAKLFALADANKAKLKNSFIVIFNTTELTQTI